MNDTTAGPEVLLIVPTHDHASTLDLAVRSALEQTFSDLDVVIIGDGVGDDTREVVHGLAAADDRVRFLDQPKSPSRAEPTRHAVVAGSDARIVTYLGDDDLLLPDHVETMRDLLEAHDFAHPFPIVIDQDDRLMALPTDLADPRCVAWHLQPQRNTVSLTGAAHTMAFYRRIAGGWQAPPPGRWPDHHMWQKVLAVPGVRVVTSPRATTIKPAASLRALLDPASQSGSLRAWWERMHEPGFASWWEVEVRDAVRRIAIETFMDRVDLQERVQELEPVLGERDVLVARVGELDAAIEELRAELAQSSADAADARAEIERMRATRTWRLHDRVTDVPLLRRLLARAPS